MLFEGYSVVKSPTDSAILLNVPSDLLEQAIEETVSEFECGEISRETVKESIVAGLKGQILAGLLDPYKMLCRDTNFLEKVAKSRL